MVESLNDHGGQAQVPFVGFSDYSFPIYAARYDGDQLVKRKVRLRRYSGDEGYPHPTVESVRENGALYALDVPLPAGEFRPAGPQNTDSDGSLIIYDPSTRMAWDIWQATTELDESQTNSLGGGIASNRLLWAGSVAKYSLDEFGVEAGGRASGLPYLGGLLKAEDLMAGSDSRIEHALAFTLPRLRYFDGDEGPPNYVYPASRTETTAFSRNPYALAAGQRIRLKPWEKIRGPAFMDVNKKQQRVPLKIDSLAPITRIVLLALQNYGAYLVDGSGSFGLASEDYHTADPVLDSALAEDLIGGPYDTNAETPWQAIMGTLNSQLCCELFDVPAGHAQGYVAGLPFAVGRVLETPKQCDFFCNFDIVEGPTHLRP